MNNDRKELRTASSLYKGNRTGAETDAKREQKQLKGGEKGKQNSKQNGKQKSMEILKKGGEKRKQNNKQIGKQKQEKIEEKPKKCGTQPSRIRKVGKTHFRAAFLWSRRQAGNPLSVGCYAGKIFFDFA